MTAFIPGLIIGFILALFAMILLVFLVALHRPRYEAPTLNRRRNRDRPVAEVVPSWEQNEVGGIRYEHLGMTGLEE